GFLASAESFVHSAPPPRCPGRAPGARPARMLSIPALTTMSLDDESEEWIAAFHRGDRAVLEQCYREHFETVARAVGTVLHGVDRESAIQDFFARMIAEPGMRTSFQGG